MRTLHQLCAGLVLVALTVSSGAIAGDFEVEPTRVDLTRRGVSTQLTITNRGPGAARFQATAFTWSEDSLGHMQLAPAPDIVVFPTLFTLAPGTHRAIRIATTAKPSAVERSYRIFVQELPQPNAHTGTPPAIVVLTRIGVPIFVAPMRVQLRGDIAAVMRAGSLQVSVANHGTVHVKVAAVRVTGKRHDGKTVFVHEQPSWYVLAGGIRNYTVALATHECRSTEQLAIEATTDRGTWQSTITMPPDGCR